MGCQCNKKTEEEELNKDSPDFLSRETENKNLENEADLNKGEQIESNKNQLLSQTQSNNLSKHEMNERTISLFKLKYFPTV